MTWKKWQKKLKKKSDKRKNIHSSKFIGFVSHAPCAQRLSQSAFYGFPFRALRLQTTTTTTMNRTKGKKCRQKSRIVFHFHGLPVSHHSIFNILFFPVHSPLTLTDYMSTRRTQSHQTRINWRLLINWLCAHSMRDTCDSFSSTFSLSFSFWVYGKWTEKVATTNTQSIPLTTYSNCVQSYQRNMKN